MAALAPSSSHPYPNGIHAFVISFDEDTAAGLNGDNLGNALVEFLGAEVTYCDEKAFRPDVPDDITINHPGDSAKWRSPMKRLDEWLGEVDPPEGEESSGRLLVVCYHGHAGPDKGTYEMEGKVKNFDRLGGWSGARDDIRFDLTAVKTTMRDKTNSDSLLFFECCYGAYSPEIPVSKLEHDRTCKGSKVELLAAGKGEVGVSKTYRGKEQDWASRFVSALSRLVGRMTVKDTFDEELHDKDIRHAPGWYQDCSGKGSIVLQQHSQD